MAAGVASSSARAPLKCMALLAAVIPARVPTACVLRVHANAHAVVGQASPPAHWLAPRGPGCPCCKAFRYRLCRCARAPPNRFTYTTRWHSAQAKGRGGAAGSIAFVHFFDSADIIRTSGTCSLAAHSLSRAPPRTGSFLCAFQACFIAPLAARANAQAVPRRVVDSLVDARARAPAASCPPRPLARPLLGHPSP